MEKMLALPPLKEAFSRKLIGEPIKRMVMNAFAGGWNAALQAEWERRFETVIERSSLGTPEAKRFREEGAKVYLANPVNPEAPTVADLARGEDLTPFIRFQPKEYAEVFEPPQVGAPVFLDGKQVGVVSKVVPTGVGNWEVNVRLPDPNVLAGPGLRPVHVVSGSAPKPDYLPGGRHHPDSSCD